MKPGASPAGTNASSAADRGSRIRAGCVLAVSRRWKEPERVYRQAFTGATPPVLGDVQFVDVGDTLTIANMIAQHGIRRVGGTAPIRQRGVIGLEHRARATRQNDHPTFRFRRGIHLAPVSEAVETPLRAVARAATYSTPSWPSNVKPTSVMIL